MAEKTDILKEALDRFADAQAGTEYNRENYEHDTKFARLADQWPDKVRKQRQDEDRPCLTINRLPGFIRQVVNDARQNKPGITISPVDNGADEDTAEVISGLIRSIERHSNADDAYDTAIDHAATGGFGFFRVVIEYAHDESFDLEARIERIPNAMMVHWDPTSMATDASDWRYAFISDFIPAEEFKRQYPNAAAVDFEAWDDEVIDNWIVDDQVRIAEYWVREPIKKKIFYLTDQMGGQILESSGFKRVVSESFMDEYAEQLLEQGIYAEKEREVDTYKVMKYTVSGAEVLEEEEWPGTMIPICPVWGDEVVIDGHRWFRSMIADAIDPQRMFNYWRSATTELVALAPKAPYIVAEGSIPPHAEHKWRTANTRSHAYLPFDPSSNFAPQRQPFAGVPAGALQEAMNASDDMKSTTGVYDAALGARSNETSGRAILARQSESDVSNFHFIDNLNRAIKYCGRVLLEIIPAVYSPRQTIRILGEDQAEKVVRLVASNPSNMGVPPGEERLYDLSVGKYDVTVKSGPSYGTQRQEARETLIELMRAVPNAAPIIGDLLMDVMDFQGADKVSERLKMMLPPQILQAEGIGQQLQGSTALSGGMQPPPMQ